MNGISMMTPEDFARRNAVSRDTVERCINGKSKTYPPLKAKRVRAPGSRGPGRLYITAEAEQEWKNAIPDA